MRGNPAHEIPNPTNKRRFQTALRKVVKKKGYRKPDRKG